MYSSTELLNYVERHAIDAELVRLAEQTPTVETAAAAIGVEPDDILKSLLFLADGSPHLVISNGTGRVGYKALADHLGTSRRRVRLARPNEVASISGYPVGTVPPFGHKLALATLVARPVLDRDIVYAGGGEINALLRLSTAELLRVTAAEILTL